jgi:hypothetical protein
MFAMRSLFSCDCKDVMARQASGKRPKECKCGALFAYSMKKTMVNDLSAAFTQDGGAAGLLGGAGGRDRGGSFASSYYSSDDETDSEDSEDDSLADTADLHYNHYNSRT